MRKHKLKLQTTTLEELKTYLRIDGDDDDALLHTLALGVEETVEGVLGYPLSKFADIPVLVLQTVLILTARRYENRLGENVSDDSILARNLLVNHRERKW